MGEVIYNVGIQTLDGEKIATGYGLNGYKALVPFIIKHMPKNVPVAYYSLHALNRNHYIPGEVPQSGTIAIDSKFFGLFKKVIFKGLDI